MLKLRVTLLTTALLVILGSAFQATAADLPGVQELEWFDLVPEGYNPDKIIEEYQQKYKIDELDDDDPLIVELMGKLNEVWKMSPVNPVLNGKTVKLPGYVVPLETDGQKASEFLLVPYYGACIHVPPPPSNQTVYVTTKDKEGAAIRQLFDVVWVTGVMKTEKLSTDMADAGYVIEASSVEPYQ